jgi:hypothetical protein
MGSNASTWSATRFLGLFSQSRSIAERSIIGRLIMEPNGWKHELKRSAKAMTKGMCVSVIRD